MLNNKHFPLPKVTELNNDTRQAWARMPVRWRLCNDSARFHVFLVLEMGAPFQRTLRIDWHQTSVLECRPYEPTRGDELVAVGETRGFWWQGLVQKLMGYDREYHLFAYNCRTVAYLILTEYAGFDPRVVFELYEQHAMLCGLDGIDACVSPDEFWHYIKHRGLERARGGDVDEEVAQAARYLDVK